MALARICSKGVPAPLPVLDAGGDVLAPFDAAQNRGGELGVARVPRKQIGRVHQRLEHVVEVVHQAGERQIFASLHGWAICRSVAKNSGKDTPADSAPSMAHGPSAASAATAKAMAMRWSPAESISAA